MRRPCDMASVISEWSQDLRDFVLGSRLPPPYLMPGTGTHYLWERTASTWRVLPVRSRGMNSRSSHVQ